MTARVDTQAVIAATLTCVACNRPAALVEIVEPGPLVVPEVLEFAVRAILRFCARDVPAVSRYFARAQRGDWSGLVSALVEAVDGRRVSVTCERCRRHQDSILASVIADGVRS